ncbi:MAG: hypothetical protein ACM3SP_06525 [Chloroflexota bacterium]
MPITGHVGHASANGLTYERADIDVASRTGKHRDKRGQDLPLHHRYERRAA